ncbi:MAG: hypothetical protein SV375_00070 [Thermodesulfobacteriota bacterium]|nr:hypothetical protein [Thermodesulfobacteriota bacterium]
MKKKNINTRDKQDVSLDEVRDMIWQALNERDEESYLHTVYGSYLIYEKESKYYKLPYSILEGAVQFGADETEVERVWVETRSQQDEGEENIITDIRLGQAQDPEGTAWDVTICEPGFTKNGWYHPEDALRAGADLFNGVDVNLFDLKEGATHVPDSIFDAKKYLVKSKVGWIDGVRYVAGVGLKGTLHFLDSAKWLGKNLLSGIREGAKVYGLSYDAPVRAKKDIVTGRKVMRLLSFMGVDSVDIVTRPAAGGKFNRAVAAQNGGEIMDKQQLWDMINGARPDLLNGKEIDSVSDDELQGLARMAMAPASDPGGGDPGGGDPGGGGSEGADLISREEFDLFRCSQALDRTILGSDLPDQAANRVRAAFADRVFDQADLDKAVTDEKDYIAGLAKPAEEDDTIPGGRVQMDLDSGQKVQMAIDRTFGLTQEDMEGFYALERLDHQRVFMDMTGDYEGFADVPPFHSLGEMYALLTGDPEVIGRFNPAGIPRDLRSSMNITSSTFTYLLGNTLNRRMIKAYARPNYNEDILISLKKPVKDFRQQEAVKIGGFSKIEDVNPETGEYQEIAAITDEEATYTVTTKGNILSISRKTIINDDLYVVQRFVDALGIAAAWTFADFVWSFFVDNSNCADGTAWFTSAHGNLGSSALTIATAYAALTALAKMTEKDSGRRLGLLDREDVKVALVHPPDLRSAAASIANDDYYYTSNDLTTKTANPCKGRVRPVQCSLLTDTTDWGMILPGTEVDNLEVGFLQGRENPEMFLADTPQSEQVFVADNIRYKIRHEYSGTPVDYVGAYKAVV